MEVPVQIVAARERWPSGGCSCAAAAGAVEATRLRPPSAAPGPVLSHWAFADPPTVAPRAQGTESGGPGPSASVGGSHWYTERYFRGYTYEGSVAPQDRGDAFASNYRASVRALSGPPASPLPHPLTGTAGPTPPTGHPDPQRPYTIPPSIVDTHHSPVPHDRPAGLPVIVSRPPPLAMDAEWWCVLHVLRGALCIWDPRVRRGLQCG